MNTEQFIKLSRVFAGVVGVFFATASLGGFTIGLSMRHGDFLALSCLSIGITLTCYLWWLNAKAGEHSVWNWQLTLLISFAITAGLALYATLSWGLWALGFPMSIGTVQSGRMAEHFWLGPCTGIYAVVVWLTMKWQSKKN